MKRLIPGGPAAGFLAIKQIGSNGGGFFNANSAHPFENPTQLANVVELYLTVALAFDLAVAYGVVGEGQARGPHGARPAVNVLELNLALDRAGG